MFDRFIKLIGEEKFKVIQKTKVLLVGVGGVGSYSLEALIRNGFLHITIIDPDLIELSNLNRQLYTNKKNIGLSKVESAKERALLINENANIEALETKLDSTNFDSVFSEKYDYVIDACDDINTKFLLMKNSNKYNYKLISSMGTAKKLDPTKLILTTLDKTTNDPLAKILRKKVKDEQIRYKIHVVSSNEQPLKIPFLGSNNLVPSTAGLYCVYYIIDDILK